MAIPVRSKRLLLRDMCAADWPAVHNYSNHPEVYRYQLWGPSTVAETQAFVAEALAAARHQPRAHYTFAIVTPPTQAVIGTGSLILLSQAFRYAELHYFLHPDAWGHGYATKIAQRLLAFGFATCGLHRISGMCDPRNTASARVLEKIGMRREGHARETMLLRDGWRDTLLYSILEQEWQP